MGGKIQRMLAVAGLVLALACSLAQAQGAREIKLVVKPLDFKVEANIPTPSSGSSSLDLPPRPGKIKYWLRCPLISKVFSNGLMRSRCRDTWWCAIQRTSSWRCCSAAIP